MKQRISEDDEIIKEFGASTIFTILLIIGLAAMSIIYVGYNLETHQKLREKVKTSPTIHFDDTTCLDHLDGNNPQPKPQ